MIKYFGHVLKDIKYSRNRRALLNTILQFKYVAVKDVNKNLYYLARLKEGKVDLLSELEGIGDVQVSYPGSLSKVFSQSPIGKTNQTQHFFPYSITLAKVKECNMVDFFSGYKYVNTPMHFQGDWVSADFICKLSKSVFDTHRGDTEYGLMVYKYDEKIYFVSPTGYISIPEIYYSLVKTKINEILLVRELSQSMEEKICFNLGDHICTIIISRQEVSRQAKEKCVNWREDGNLLNLSVLKKENELYGKEK